MAASLDASSNYQSNHQSRPRTQLCAICLAVPLEIFRRQPHKRSNSISQSEDGYDEDYSGSNSPTALSSSSSEDCCYQHYSGSDALAALSTSSRDGCPLCKILWFSLEASRQLLPRSALRTPILPSRLPEETGITLHSFDDDHFIVRDDVRWSLVRFLGGNRVNEQGYLLYDKANDEGVFALIEDWISECTEHHNSCTVFRLNSYPGYVPARLIRISNVRGNFQVTLCSKQYNAHYIALSHCWGSRPELVPRTTKSNLKSRMEGIPWQELTKTFRDAMETTIELGLSYIWIDSLCIVQDDPKDLEVHCESMSQIYSNSFCTISATGATDGTEGLFMPRNNEGMYPCVIEPAIPTEMTEDDYGNMERPNYGIHGFTILPTFREWIYSMKGPLLTRGWTLQERELSVRVIHFTSDRVVWECREQYASEDDPFLKAKSMLFDAGLKFRLLDGNIRDRKDRPSDYKFSKWMELVEEYTSRKLSCKDDKLRAIAGLADAIKSIQQDDVYLSGLWKRNLATELLWYAIPNPEHSNSHQPWPPEPVARGIPTWSWAAYNRAVVFDRSQENETSVCSAHLRKATSSQITLSGLVFDVPLSEAKYNPPDTVNNRKHYKWPRENSGDRQIYITLDADPESTQELRVFCLVLVEHNLPQISEQSETSPPSYSQSCSSISEHLPRQIWDGYRSAAGLVLLPVHGNTTTSHCHNLFRRVGIFNARGRMPETLPVEVEVI